MLRSAEALFLGSHVNKVDAKGRIAAPADFRRALNLEAFNGFYCLPSLRGPFLDCGGGDYVSNLQQMASALDPFDPDREALHEWFNAQTRRIAFDGDGRFVLPPALRDHARLADSAYFVGLGEMFQIRSGEGAEQRQAEIADRARSALSRLKNPVLPPMEAPR